MKRYFIIIVIAGTLGAIVAQPKSRSALLWFVVCAIFPLLLNALAILPHVLVKRHYNKCRHCAEIVKEDAETCKCCGQGL